MGYRMPPLPRLKAVSKIPGRYVGFAAYIPGVQPRVWGMLSSPREGEGCLFPIA